MAKLTKDTIIGDVLKIAPQTAPLFQAIGNGRLSFLMSALRQLIILLPAAFIFSRIWGLSAVWYAFPVAEIFALIFASIMMVKVYNAQIRYLEG